MHVALVCGRAVYQFKPGEGPLQPLPLLSAFDRQGYTLTAADAQGGQAFAGITLDHFV
ncbi:hypothetical protein D3C84_950200 [compost metagenome]